MRVSRIRKHNAPQSGLEWSECRFGMFEVQHGLEVALDWMVALDVVLSGLNCF